MPPLHCTMPKAAESAEKAPEAKPEPKPAAPAPKEEKKEALPF